MADLQRLEKILKIVDDGSDLSPEKAQALAQHLRAQTAEVATLRAELEALENGVREAQRIAAEQAEDEALWAISMNIVEAYVQQELRRLTAAVEAIKLGAAAPPSGGTP